MRKSRGNARPNFRMMGRAQNLVFGIAKWSIIIAGTLCKHWVLFIILAPVGLTGTTQHLQLLPGHALRNCHDGAAATGASRVAFNSFWARPHHLGKLRSFTDGDCESTYQRSNDGLLIFWVCFCGYVSRSTTMPYLWGKIPPQSASVVEGHALRCHSIWLMNAAASAIFNPKTVRNRDPCCILPLCSPPLLLFLVGGICPNVLP